MYFLRFKQTLNIMYICFSIEYLLILASIKIEHVFEIINKFVFNGYMSMPVIKSM